MASPVVALRDVYFSYAQSAEPLFAGLSLSFPVGFSAIVGVNGAGKSSLLKILAGQLQPDAGSLEGLTHVVYCEQRTDEPPAQLALLLDDWDADAFELRGRLAVPQDALARWPSLSHGERKRVQIACALWLQPTVLLLDEPTNHIDAAGRELLESALRRFAGTGVIVSHDRDLLDALCVQCVWLQAPAPLTIPGGYTRTREALDRQRLSVQRTRKTFQAQARALNAELARRRESASRADAARSKRGVAAKDSDARERIDRARLTGKDGTAGKLLRQLDGRAAQNAAEFESLRVEKDHATGVWVAGEVSKANSLFDVAEGELALGSSRVLRYPALRMRPTDRIALTGANGLGKSTLLQRLLEQTTVPEERLVVLPQEVTAERSAELLREVQALPKAHLGQVMSVVSRLGSRPGRLLVSHEPSPGEVRKLILALGIVRAPWLLVLDEPTNHLDVLAVEALEEALVGCPCGIVLVSHDRRLVASVAAVEWRIEREGQNCILTPEYLEHGSG